MINALLILLGVIAVLAMSVMLGRSIERERRLKALNEIQPRILEGFQSLANAISQLGTPIEKASKAFVDFGKAFKTENKNKRDR